MLTAPYSIYINKRPLRVAFLIEDKPESLAIIDAIFAYANSGSRSATGSLGEDSGSGRRPRRRSRRRTRGWAGSST
jgi:hypothetical protein